MEEQSVSVSRVDVISNSLVVNLVPWAIIASVVFFLGGYMADMDGLYLFGLLANLLAAAVILGFMPWWLDRRKDETLLLNSEGIRWSSGEMRLADIRKVRLYERPDGDIRQMWIAGRRQRLRFPQSMEEYKLLADWLRARLPEDKFYVIRLG